MCQFIESIKCKNGKLDNMNYHNARFNLTLKVNFNINSHEDLTKIITIPTDCKEGLFKCRIIYSNQIHKIEFVPYSYRKINSLKLIEDDEIEYSYKYANRDSLNLLFSQRGNSDDILIVKNGNITDSFAANVVFFDGKNWWTPDTVLLPGTKRASLIDHKKIFVTRITLKNLKKYKFAGLINAMQGLEEISKIPISQIIGIK